MPLQTIESLQRASATRRDAALTPQLINALKLDSIAELAQLARGLLAPAAAISPKYFYDALGSTLYDAIVLTPEYYPTRTERAIHETYRAEIAAAIGSHLQFVDLGSGDSAKAETWFNALRPSRYVAVDISESAVRAALARISGRFEHISIAGLITDFSRVLDVQIALSASPTLFFYPGSSIGNFMPDEASWFLKQIAAHRKTHDCKLLIGVDLKKDVATLEAAYDDALGVTASFNRNTLLHVNRLLGANFETKDWKHVALYNAPFSRIEMHLEAIRETRVLLSGHTRHFARGERIHTENSYKYSIIEFKALLHSAGFAESRVWHDDAQRFAVFLAG